MMVGNPPFCKKDTETSYQIYLRVLAGKMRFPRKFHPQARILVRGLLDHEVERRVVDPAKIKVENEMIVQFLSRSQSFPFLLMMLEE